MHYPFNHTMQINPNIQPISHAGEKRGKSKNGLTLINDAFSQSREEQRVKTIHRYSNQIINKFKN